MQSLLQNVATISRNPPHAKLSLVHNAAAEHSAPPLPIKPGTPTTPVAVIEYNLTAAEREVLDFAARGLQNAEIAQRRNVSVGTIKAQMHRIFEKLGTHSRFEAALLYRVALNIDVDTRQRDDDLDFNWLSHLALTVEQWPAGHLLFRQGDLGDKLYYIAQGEVCLPEKADSVMGPRTLFGEIAVFSPGYRRTFSAQCRTDVKLLSMTQEQVQRCYRVYPQFAIYIQFSAIRRLMADRTSAVP